MCFLCACECVSGCVVVGCVCVCGGGVSGRRRSGKSDAAGGQTVPSQWICRTRPGAGCRNAAESWCAGSWPAKPSAVRLVWQGARRCHQRCYQADMRCGCSVRQVARRLRPSKRAQLHRGGCRAGCAATWTSPGQSDRPMAHAPVPRRVAPATPVAPRLLVRNERNITNR